MERNTRTEFFGVRYIINDLGEVVSFYRDLLGFQVDMQVEPGFAKLSKGSLNLYFNKPGFGGAGQSMPDGTVPQPGGWNRIQLGVDNLDALIEQLKAKQASFRNELIVGQGGKQILLKDPSGNLIELFEPKK
ncbi:VOC family protein [Flavihumibacter petaseus]|nr:VOC family protein [Flavihumibacter petaseus]